MTFPGATRAAIVVASLYYPFVDIGGYFLPEPYVALFGTFSLACWFWVVRLIEAAPACRRITGKIAAVAAAGGVSLAVAAAMSFLAVSAVLATVLLHLALTKGPPRRSRAVAAGVLFLAAVPVLGWQTERCTSANGTLCPSTNTIPADVLVGHYGRIQAIIWRDPTTGLSASRGSPSFWQHGYRERPEVQHRITNQRKNLQLAWKWTRKHPWQALTVSSEHVWDTLAGVHAWPTVGTAYWPPLYAFQYLFIVLLFFPTSALLVDLARRRGIKGMLQSVELATLGPIFGLSLWVFFTWGEPRFRFPWDGSFIILTIEFFRRLKVPLSLADPPAAEAAARAATEPQPEPQPAEEAA
jgi:hypothetical protein